MSVIAGHDGKDPESRDEEVPDYPAAMCASFPQFRVGVPRKHFFEGAETAVVSAVSAALKLLENEHQDLIEIHLAEASSGRESAALITAVESAEVVTDEMLEKRKLFGRAVLSRLESRSGIAHEDYERAKKHAAVIRAELLAALEDVDAIATPTCPLLPIFIGERSRKINGTEMNPGRYLGRYTSVFGLAHLPAVSVPCGFSHEGLPIGMQLVGAPFQETKLLQLAGLLESATSLKNLRPHSTLHR
jgi:aspartyl-tRNA(Asn)/glutamyl-tRNA(Gln) amidotransferase subunit A